MVQKVIISPLYIMSFILSIACLISACSSTKKIDNSYLYFSKGSDTIQVQQRETTIQPNDLLSIQVFSRTLNQEQAAIFNLSNTSTNAPQGSTSFTEGYQVSSTGTIDMPVIGSIRVSGFTKDQLQILLAKRLSDYVKNPSVLVRFLQFSVNVLGEVRSPGTQKFSVDRVTIIDAIGSAGDLTDFGRREDVTVIREENGKRIFHRIDLRRKDIFESPVYVLQPNDIVYVNANKKKLKALNVNEQAQRTTGLVLSVISIATTITYLIVTILR